MNPTTLTALHQKKLLPVPDVLPASTEPSTASSTAPADASSSTSNKVKKKKRKRSAYKRMMRKALKKDDRTKVWKSKLETSLLGGKCVPAKHQRL